MIHRNHVPADSRLEPALLPRRSWNNTHGCRFHDAGVNAPSLLLKTHHHSQMRAIRESAANCLESDRKNASPGDQIHYGNSGITLRGIDTKLGVFSSKTHHFQAFYAISETFPLNQHKPAIPFRTSVSRRLPAQKRTCNRKHAP